MRESQLLVAAPGQPPVWLPEGPKEPGDTAAPPPHLAPPARPRLLAIQEEEADHAASNTETENESENSICPLSISVHLNFPSTNSILPSQLERSSGVSRHLKNYSFKV